MLEKYLLGLNTLDMKQVTLRGLKKAGAISTPFLIKRFGLFNCDIILSYHQENFLNKI